MTLLFPVLPYLLPFLFNLYGQLYYKADGYHQPHRSGDYEDYEEDFYDNWRSDFRRRRRGPGKRARVGDTDTVSGQCQTELHYSLYFRRRRRRRRRIIRCTTAMTGRPVVSTNTGTNRGETWSLTTRTWSETWWWDWLTGSPMLST